MHLYRIANCRYITDLEGTGARLYGGRWNRVGTSMVYFAANRALAAMEVLVNVSILNDPELFCIGVFDVPDTSIWEIHTAVLPDNWNSYPAPGRLKKIGDQFIRANEYLLLKVPSAVVADEYNYLLNPAHSKAREIRLLDRKTFVFNKRLS